MTDKPKRWGQGRVRFIAEMGAIRSEIEQGRPLTEVFGVRSSQLGIGYSAFCKLVARYAADAKPQLAAPTTPPSPSTDPSPQTGQLHASSGDFGKNYDATLDADRLRRLIGTRPQGRK
jgi:hypothetical protein